MSEQPPSMFNLRTIVAAAAVVVGGVWIAQGTGHLGGSFMTGDSTWTVIGAALIVVAVALWAWSYRSVKRSRR